ncbi:MAG: acyl-CoA thioesterase [Comamonas sp.]
MTNPSAIAELHELVLPAHANHRHTLFAGQGLQWLAKAAFLAARRLAQREVVMARVTQADFLAPAPLGCELVLRAWVSRVGTSSMTVCVSAVAGLPRVAPEEVLKAVFEMVAVDAAGRPAAIHSNDSDKEPIA